MLVITRNQGQSFFIGDDIEVTFLEGQEDGSIRIGIQAPRDVAIERAEIHIPGKGSMT